jgi:hypothetical protein
VHLVPGLEFQNLKFEKLGFPHKTLVAVAVSISVAVPVAVTLEVLKGLVIITVATRWCHYLQILSEVCTHICLNC